MNRLERARRIAGVRFAHDRRQLRRFARAERREMPSDLGLRHRVERRRPPARRVVLVDDHRAHPFIEVFAVNDARHYAEFGLHARIECEGFAGANLRQRKLQARRRFGPDGCGGRAGKFGVRASRPRLAFERRERCLRRWSPRNSRSIACAARRHRPASPGGSANAASSASTDVAPHSASRNSAKRADATRCVASVAAHHRPRQPLAGQRAIGAELAGQSAAGTRSRRHREKSRC